MRFENRDLTRSRCYFSEWPQSQALT